MAFDPVQFLSNGVERDVVQTFCDHFPDAPRAQQTALRDAVALAMHHVTRTSASYHGADHTIMVTMAGQDILRGKAQDRDLDASDWIHGMAALLFHDIGYSRTACKDDTEDALVTDSDGGRFHPQAGSSDAILAPWHVDRGMIFVRETFAGSDILDADRLAAAIDYTRFPVPADPQYARLDDEPSLVRAADLIGQLADPRYPQKLTHLYHEMRETGAAPELGYQSALDMVNAFPGFFHTLVEPYIGPALGYLERTTEGREWIHRLHRVVAQTETGALPHGPFRGGSQTGSRQGA